MQYVFISRVHLVRQGLVIILGLAGHHTKNTYSELFGTNPGGILDVADWMSLLWVRIGLLQPNWMQYVVISRVYFVGQGLVVIQHLAGHQTKNTYSELFETNPGGILDVEGWISLLWV